MDEKEAPDDYEVGYGKPPKHTRFQKGTSGNSKGRPQKALDFDAALLREARTIMTINENGRQIRISKHDLIVKQLTNGAIKGNNSGLRMYLDAYRQAFEKTALLEASQSRDSGRYDDVRYLTDEELMRIAATGSEKPKRKKKK